MQFDQKQNTEALQERFPEVYRKFFAENDLVVSSSVNFTYTSVHSYRIGGLDIFQKLPFRGYMGIKKEEGTGRLRLGSIEVYFSDKNHFSSEGHYLHFLGKGFEYLKEYFGKALGRDDFPSLRFNLLLEQPENIGFGTSIATLIMVGTQFYYGLLSSEELEMMTSLKSKVVLEKSGDVAQRYRRLHADILKFITQLVRPTASGGTIYANVTASEYPLIYCTEERRGSDRDSTQDFFPSEVFENVNVFDEFRWFGFRLNEGAQLNGQFPLDVVSIFPGVGKGEILEMYEAAHRTMVVQFEELQVFIKEVFSALVTGVGPEHLPPFCKNFSEPQYFWYEYTRGQLYSVLLLFKRLVELYQHKSSSNAFQGFVEALHAQNVINEPFEEAVSRNMQYIMRKIYQKADEIGVPVAVRLLSTGKQDASILVFSQIPKFREGVIEMVDELRNHYDQRVHINFASWRDGWGKDGIRVEQFISKGVYSKFVGSQSYRLREWDGKSGEAERVTEDVEKTKGEFDILLDKVDGKIYIKGEECTSRELPTQKAAIEVLVYLLEHRGETAPNKTLPAQTYTSYRNEFQGKIVTPLNQLIKKRLGKDLGLKIHGKLMAFDVQFKPVDLKIGILEKMG